VLKYEFDIAIIGAGSYGLPIASFIKTLGKTAIHLGGVTQLMFAIMGKRWESVNHVTLLDQSGWVRPKADETPRYANAIEDGCYW
jgi:malic enzyme